MFLQLDILRNVQSSHGKIKFNYRPIQEIGIRDVYHHMEGYSASSFLSSSLSVTFISVVVTKIITT